MKNNTGYIGDRGVVIGALLILFSLATNGSQVSAQGLLRWAQPAAAHTNLRINVKSDYHTPKPGSAERKAILDALRIPVEKDLGMRVIFVVSHPASSFRVMRDWAFVDAQFRHPDGKPMGEHYHKNTEASDNVQALLHRVNGKWRVVAHVTGPTDVEWEDWPSKYHAPPTIIPRTM